MTAYVSGFLWWDHYELGYWYRLVYGVIYTFCTRSVRSLKIAYYLMHEVEVQHNPIENS